MLEQVNRLKSKLDITSKDLEPILKKLESTPINAEIQNSLIDVFSNINKEDELEIANSIKSRRRLRGRIEVNHTDEVISFTINKDPLNPAIKKAAIYSVLAVIVIVIAAVAGSSVYHEFIEEHPMESVALECNDGILYQDGEYYADAGRSFTVESLILPENTTDKLLNWISNMKDVTITHTDSGVSVLIGATVETGSTLTITASSSKYDVSGSISITVENNIVLTLDSGPSNVSVGDTITVRSSDSSDELDLVPDWSVDQNWAILSKDGNEATVSIGYSAKKGDSVVLMAFIPGTGISESVILTVSDGLALNLSTSTDTVSAGSSFTVSASITPSLPSGTPVLWSVLDRDGNTVDSIGFTTGKSGPSVWFNDRLSGTVSRDADDGIIMIISMKVPKYDLSETVSIQIVNEAKRPIEVYTVSDLAAMGNSSRIYRLQNDLDLSDSAWSPFQFSGTFDGNGHRIYGLKLDLRSKTSSGEYYGGLFSINNGTITDLILDKISITIAPNSKGASAMIYAGAVCGINKGTISGVEVGSSSILAHSTDIKVSWLSSHASLPAVASGDAKSGDWHDYASLSFTGVMVLDWTKGAKMNVHAGGIAGSNIGSISSCITDIDIDAQVINFRTGSSNYTTDAERALVYAGGIAGKTSAQIKTCTSHGYVSAQLVLHDSGTGTDGGDGYFGGSYAPKGIGYVGGIAGYSGGQLTGESDCTLNHHTEVFAPATKIGIGSQYNRDKSTEKNIQWYEGRYAGAVA